MRVTCCPVCGRKPEIKECVPYKNVRRRMAIVECYHDCVYDSNSRFKNPWFIFYGEGDDNAIFKEWNRRIEAVKNLDFCLPHDFYKKILKEEEETIRSAKVNKE